MKLNEAIEIGKAEGLKTDAECFNNAMSRMVQMFPWKDVELQMLELMEDAKNHGMKFSKICTCAIEPDADENQMCPTCREIDIISRGTIGELEW